MRLFIKTFHETLSLDVSPADPVLTVNTHIHTHNTFSHMSLHDSYAQQCKHFHSQGLSLHGSYAQHYQVKHEIERRRGVPVSEQRLVFGGRPLQDLQLLSAYDLQDESTVDQVVDVLGGHCQVPCGIFDDPKTVAEVKEHAATIRKAMSQINELHAKGDAQSCNQMTRWVMTKEEHANHIITTISEYCLCQRVKPAGAPKSPFGSDKDFEDALRAHHLVLVKAMAAKQNVAEAAADALDHAIGDWSKMYIPEKSNL